MDCNQVVEKKDQQPVYKKSTKLTIMQKADIDAFMDDQNLMKLSICIPDSVVDNTPPPMDIICVIDISYSMGGSAACQTDGKTEYEDLGFSLIDLVKHAVKTVVKCMRSTDRISIILFDDRIQVPYNFTLLNDANRDEIIKFVDTINRRSSTNIYDALKKSIDLVMERTGESGQTRPANDAAVLFFTDGQPNCGKY